jgi:hypothetical protein
MRGRDELGAVPHSGVGAQVEQPGELERVPASGVGLGQQPVRARGLQAVLAVAPLTEVLPTTSQRATAASRVAPHLSRAIESAALPLSCANSVESFPQVRRPPEKSLIAVGAKRIETRSWGTGYHGPLAIHAGKTRLPELPALTCDPLFYRALAPHFPDPAAPGGLRGPATLRLERLPFGAVIAVAELVDVRRIVSPEALGHTLGDNEIAFGDFTPGRFAWLLANVQPLPEPIPARGALGLWHWSRP